LRFWCFRSINYCKSYYVSKLIFIFFMKSCSLRFTTFFFPVFHKLVRFPALLQQSAVCFCAMLASCCPCLSRGPAKSYTAWCLGLVVHRCVKLCRNGVPLRFWCFRSINYCKSYVAKFKVYSEIVTFPRGCMDSDCTGSLR
jgi:hypothetical protein